MFNLIIEHQGEIVKALVNLDLGIEQVLLTTFSLDVDVKK